MGNDTLASGFMNHDYVVTFAIADPERRARLVALCEGPWQGDEITEHCWEVSNDLDPNALEQALLAQMGPADRVAYYYLTPSLEAHIPGMPPGKRIFRVVLG